MLTTIFALLFLGKPEQRLELKDISITQTVSAVRMLLPGTLPQFNAPPGRVKRVVIEVRPHTIMVLATGFNILTDPVRSIRGVYLRRTREYALTAEALGGLIELTGVLPE